MKGRELAANISFWLVLVLMPLGLLRWTSLGLWAAGGLGLVAALGAALLVALLGGLLGGGGRP